jgi:hypothetical protein
MRRFLFVNIKIYTYLCKKLSYTPCYVQYGLLTTKIKNKLS